MTKLDNGVIIRNFRADGTEFDTKGFVIPYNEKTKYAYELVHRICEKARQEARAKAKEADSEKVS